jgi:ribose transport system substrate-binding protein
MKKAFLLVLVVLFMFTAVSLAATYKVGVSIPTADHGWTGGINYWAAKAIEDWEAKRDDIEFFLVASSDPQRQVSDIEDLMVKGIDALVILAHDSAPLTPIVAEVYEAGIYVVSVDRGLLLPVQDVYIAGDNPGLGRVAGQWMAEELGGEGKIVALEGIPCVINTERVEAFETEIAKYPGIELLDSQPAYWSADTGYEVMSNYLQKYPEIDAVFAQDDDVLIGVLAAYEESGRDDIKTFFGGAGSKIMIKKVMDGDPLVKADVTYPPSMIATGISLAVFGVTGEPLEGFYQQKVPSEVILAAELVTPENAHLYYEPDSVF